MLAALRLGGLVEPAGRRLKASVRVASVRGRLFLHSAYPTMQENAVFLGPDTLRFVDFAWREMQAGPPPRHVVDLGAGAGVGGIVVKAGAPDARLTLVDVNPAALACARVNAGHAGVSVDLVCSAGLQDVEDGFDLVLANPPFIMDDDRRRYRHGGGLHGAQVSLDWVLQAAARLPPGGRLLMYTGSAIVDGADPLAERLATELPPLGCDLRYREIDPDIFGEELERPGYADVERIAAVGLVVTRR